MMRKIMIVIFIAVGLGMFYVGLGALMSPALACGSGDSYEGYHQHGDWAYRDGRVHPSTDSYGYYHHHGQADPYREDVPPENSRGYGYGPEGYPGGPEGHQGH